MPIRYDIEPALGLVTSRAWGTLEDRDVLQHHIDLGRDPRFVPTYRQLGDFRDVEDFRLAMDTVRAMARNRFFDPRAKRAMVVSNEMAHQLGRMIASVAGLGADFARIYRDMPAARAFLGLDP
jgi:hypothetical protein